MPRKKKDSASSSQEEVKKIEQEEAKKIEQEEAKKIEQEEAKKIEQEEAKKENTLEKKESETKEFEKESTEIIYKTKYVLQLENYKEQITKSATYTVHLMNGSSCLEISKEGIVETNNRYVYEALLKAGFKLIKGE